MKVTANVMSKAIPRTPALAQWPHRLVVTAGGYAVVGGVITLIGWAANIPALTDWKNDGISMFPNTTACVILSGLALLLDRSSERHQFPGAVAAALLVSLIGTLTLFEHLTAINLGIDTLLFDRPWGQGAAAAPMRMGPPASLSFLTIGMAVVLLSSGRRARSVSAALGVAVMAIASLSLTGHLYSAAPMYTIPQFTGIAMQTASMILALGIAVVASVPEREPMRAILEPGAAGMLVRRALPLLVALAVGLGWLRVFIEQRGWVDTAFGTALRTVVEMVLLVGLLWRAVAMIRAHERSLRASEAEVRRQAVQLSAFLETAAIAMHRVGPDGTILWANNAELKTLGYAPEEYLGHHIAEFHADQDAIADILVRLHRGEKLSEYPARVKCKDGSIKSVLIDSSVLWDGGRFVHTQCFTRDVTERALAEQASALLAAIIETSDDAIISKRLDGIITSWNAGAERIFGYTEAEARGQSINMIIPPDRREEEREILERLRRGERIEHFETVRRAKNGRLFDISLTISPLKDASGRIVGASKIARDITDRRRTEAERVEADRRKDEFIAILAHELRNPLAPVRNAAHYLKLKGPTDPDLKRSVDMIERQVAQMSRLIDDLLDVSRISRGILELRREHVSLSEVFESALDACRDEIQAKGHRLRTSVPPDPIQLHADRERLVQVLSNLIGNAAKYTPTGGQIDLAVAARNGKVEVAVKDNGIGIPPGKLPEIFELFTRVDQSLEGQGGLGIGLTLVRQLVELHGGTVEARSKGIGYGSEFIVTLPIIATAKVPVALRPDLGLVAVPRRILIADDNRDAVESLALLLQLAGHDVHAVFDGEAAILSAENLLPEVALFDIGMPKANGYEVARRIREQPWGKQMFLVALTGWGQEADKRRTREAGFDAHLVKPVPPDALHRLLATLGEN